MSDKIEPIHNSRFEIPLIPMINMMDSVYCSSPNDSILVQKINPSPGSGIRWVENPYDTGIYVKRNLLATFCFIVTWLVLSVVGFNYFPSALKFLFIGSNLAWVALIVVIFPFLWNARAIMPVRIGFSNEGLHVKYTRKLRGMSAQYQAPELIRWSGMLKVHRNADSFLKCVHIGIKIGPRRNDWAPLQGLTTNLADEIIRNYEARKAPKQSV
jgi:hypothetical protein